MENHYNAFISYRHHPDDMRVAAEIHRALERFHVPKVLRKESNGIRRIFRDKEELPITSNLTDDIISALKNSEYLIVICSVHTRESIWVQREIETFLQTHDRSKVLTVLCSGEPYDVIPEILLHDDAVDPETGTVQRIAIEPLSCDWRMPHRKAHREELPRLAAALLGCKYDDLRQRQRQYRMRRLIAVFSVALAMSISLAAYFLYTSITIRNANIAIANNLNLALRNQSLYLSDAAGSQLENGDRLTAIALAVAALPQAEGERPYVPAAESILAEALQVYQPEEIMAVGAVGPGGNISVREFWLTEDGSVIYILDERGIITSWNTRTMEMLGTMDFSEGIVDKLIVTADGTAIVLAGKSGTCAYAVRPDGEQLWQLESCSDISYIKETNLFLAIHAVYKEEPTLVALDALTGKQAAAPVILSVPEIEGQPYRFLLEAYSENMPIAVEYQDRSICTVDLNLGKVSLWAKETERCSSAAITEDGKLLMMIPVDTGAGAGMMFGFRITAPLEYRILCYEMGQPEPLWTADFVTYSYTGAPAIEPIPETSNILFQCGSTLQIVDGTNGDILSKCEAGNGIVAMDVRPQSTLAVLQDGYVCEYSYSTNDCYEVKCMEGTLNQAGIRSGLFGLQIGGTHVVIYRTLQKDYLWNAALPDGLDPIDYRFHADQIAFTDSGRICLFDLKEQDLRWVQDRNYEELLGFSSDGAKLWTVTSDSQLKAYTTSDGQSVCEAFPLQFGGSTFRIISDVLLRDDSLCYLVCNDLQVLVVSWNPNTGETHTAQLPEGSEPDGYELLGCTGLYVWISADSESIYALDLTDGTARLIADNPEGTPGVFCQDGNHAAVYTDGKLRVYDALTLLFETDLEQTVPVSVHYRNSETLALCDNGYLYRFDSSGVLLSQTKTLGYNRYGSGFNGPQRITCQFTEDGKLILNIFPMGNIIDCDTWEVCTTIPEFLLYHPGENSFIIRTDAGIAALPRYSLNELLALAEKQLNGFRLTEEERRAFGLG